MTLTIIFICLGAGLLYGLKKKVISTEPSFLLALISAVYGFSLIPSLSIPYIIDDVDHFHNLSLANDHSLLLAWLLEPHNEHAIPLLKLIYAGCYHFFWLNPEIFHLLISGVCIGITLLTFRLLQALGASTLGALAGSTLISATNLFDETIFIVTNAHILFVLFFFLLLFYAISQYALTSKPAWRLIAFFTILIMPWTFSLGLTSIGFVVLFDWLCLDPTARQKTKNLFPLLVCGWLLSFAPYLYNLGHIVFAPHYQDVGAQSIFNIMRIPLAMTYLINTVATNLIPGFLRNPYLAFGLFFCCVLAVSRHRREIDWSKIIFFFIFGCFNNFIIYTFRMAWGPSYLEFPRYYVFLAMGLTFVYSFFLDTHLKNENQQRQDFKKENFIVAVYIACFAVVALGAVIRYNKADLVLKETMVMQNFYVNFRKALVDYLKQPDVTIPLKIKDGPMILPAASTLATKAGHPAAMGRYASRPRSFYAQYILPKEIRKKMIWTDHNDPAFEQYLIEKEYFFLIKSN